MRSCDRSGPDTSLQGEVKGTLTAQEQAPPNGCSARPGAEAHIGSLSVDQRDRLWRSIYANHFDSMYRMVYCLGVPAAEIEDLLQRVFLVAHQRMQEIPEIRNVPAWLRGIAVHVVHEHRRYWRIRRAKDWLLRSTTELDRERPASPEAMVGSSESRELVNAVLRQLSPKLRDVLVLLDLEECQPQEAAEVLGIPVNTVRSRRRLAREEFCRVWRKHVSKEDHHG